MIGIPPESFWNMSPKEVYRTLAGFMEYSGNEKEEPMGRAELEELMELYPD
tara:strand:- start:2099 stop:2251 length:153 start_codon:yes stop_codon:yes gene_type:complete